MSKTISWDWSRSFSAPVGQELEGKSVRAREINHTRRFSAVVNTVVKVEEVEPEASYDSSDLQNKPGYCYYVGAYIPAFHKLYYLGGDNLISERPEPVLCQPGKVEVPLVDLELGVLGVEVQGFYNEKNSRMWS